MNIDDLYNKLLEDNVDMSLLGEIEIEEESIKWVYDGLGKDTAEMDEHLEECWETDQDTLEEYFLENKIDTNFYFGQPDIDETIISVYIYEE